MSALERAAVRRAIDMATAAGIDVPAGLVEFACGTDGTYAATEYARLHPDGPLGEPYWDVPVEMLMCCSGAAVGGLDACTCWEPEFEVEQQRLIPLAEYGQLDARDKQCGDCAFRRDSPEQADQYLREELEMLPIRGEPFWCHDGMRRPARWRHPAGPVLEGSGDDWQPPIVGSVPYRADGRPALLCHGWAVRAARHAIQSTDGRGEERLQA